MTYHSYFHFFFLDPDPPNVTITISGNFIGSIQNLTCNVTLAQNLRERPVIDWVWPDGTRIENGTVEDLSVFSYSPSITLTLFFSPLRTSHGGIYCCRANVMDSDAGLFISTNYSYILIVPSELMNASLAKYCT